MTETLELEPDAFWREVTEHDLKVSGPSAGYMWTGKRGVAGWEVYKTRAMNKGWLYQARRVNTQNAVGGGALRTRIQMPTGVTARLVIANMIGTASAGSSSQVRIYDEDLASPVNVAAVGAAANTVINLPSIGANANAGSNNLNSLGLLLGPGQFLVFDSSAGLQTETLTVAVTLLMSANVQPTWDTTGSGGTPALAASTISAANTMQEVYTCPS